MRRRLLPLLLVTLWHLQVPAGQASLQVSEAWISEAPPGISVNAAYLVIENTGKRPVALERVTSPDYERIEMHRSFLDQGQARMRLQASVTIAAGSTLRFVPGDYHLMLFRPGRPMRIGDSTSLTLEFSDASQLTVSAEVRKLQPDHGHHH